MNANPAMSWRNHLQPLATNLQRRHRSGIVRARLAADLRSEVEDALAERRTMFTTNA